MATSDIQRLRQQALMEQYDQPQGGGYTGVVGYDIGGAGGMQNPYAYQEQQEQDQFGSRVVPQTGAQPVSPTQAPTVQAPRVDPNTSLQATIDAINRVYTPETQSRDRVNNLLDAYPERQAPSFARTLGAIGLSMKAADPIATSEKVMYAPHYRNVEDWKNQTGPAQQAYATENAANINERTLASNVVTAQTQADRLAEQVRNNDMKNEVARTTNRIREAKNNGITVKLDGDKWVGFDQNGRRYDLGSSTGMTEQEKIDAQGEWRVSAAEASGRAAMDRAVATGPQVYVDPSNGQAYVYNPRAGGSAASPVPGMPAGTAKMGTPQKTSQLDVIRQEQREMQDLYNLDPIARRHIALVNGKYQMKPRPTVTAGGIMGSGWGPGKAVSEDDVREWDAIKQKIDPNYTPQGGKPNQGLGPTTTPQAPAESPTSTGVRPGYVLMIKPDGTPIQIPEKNVKAATAAGYKRR